MRAKIEEEAIGVKPPFDQPVVVHEGGVAPPIGSIRFKAAALRRIDERNVGAFAGYRDRLAMHLDGLFDHGLGLVRLRFVDRVAVVRCYVCSPGRIPHSQVTTRTFISRDISMHLASDSLRWPRNRTTREPGIGQNLLPCMRIKYLSCASARVFYCN